MLSWSRRQLRVTERTPLRRSRQGFRSCSRNRFAKTLADATDMLVAERESAVPVLLDYTWRWWPPLARVKDLLRGGAVGPLRHVQFHMSAHLADWHPWEPYQQFFMASAAQGGGALLDESHWIDLMVWLFGSPAHLIGRVEKISDLDIDSDDTVDALVVYPNGLRISIHLDLYGRPHEKIHPVRRRRRHADVVCRTEPHCDRPRVGSSVERGALRL